MWVSLFVWTNDETGSVLLGMSRGRVPMMELKRSYDVEEAVSIPSLMEDDDDDDLWPLSEIDFKKSKFPCCIVWTPLPVVSWLAPFIGHIGLCREDGVILDFAGSNFINVDDFAFGPAARYLQLDRTKVSASLFNRIRLSMDCS